MDKGETKDNYWWDAQPHVADKQTLLELDLPTKRTSLELYLQYNFHQYY